MAQPRLLLIDDEPALAEFLANAATACGFDPIITARDEQFREEFIANRPEMVALDLGMREAGARPHGQLRRRFAPLARSCRRPA